MAVAFLTNLNEAEFKTFLRQSLEEIISEHSIANKTQTPDILSIKEAAEFLRLKLNTLYEKTSQKTIPHFKKGNKLYFYKDDLEAWLRAGKVSTTDELQGKAATFNLHKAHQRIK